MSLTYTPDYAALLAECLRHMQALIRLDTSNPPGNEILAANYIREQLALEGVESEIIETKPGRANLRAVLRGDGTMRPILLMSHTDVVPAEAEHWSHAPFSGEISGGYVWGRGAVDMKQWGSWHLTIFLDLVRRVREGLVLKRDVALLATADEEDGSYMGMRWIAANRPDWLDAEYGLSEGGGGEMRVGGRSFFTCRVAEKGACRFHLRAHGSPGHAARPHSDNALVKLGGALHRLGTTQLPMHATDTVREMLEEMLGRDRDTQGLIERLLNYDRFEDALREAPLSDTMKLALNAQLHNTVAPTILHPAGARINVIPSTAEASVDGRTMPDATVESFTQEVREVVGDAVEIEVYEYWPGSSSPFDTSLFRAMQDVTRELTGAGLVPYMATGASDARFAEPLGVAVYGYGPMREEEGSSPTGLMHAHDERLSIANVELGLRALYETVKREI